MGSKKTAVELTIVSLLALLPPLTSALDERPRYERLKLTAATGPESLAFDPSGGGPYTGVSDGRIIKWQGQRLGWIDFAVTSWQREERCYGSDDISLESICGRPLGLQFNMVTGDLYIADAYYGLVAVGPEGGVAVQLAAGADGEPFNFTNGLAIDQETGVVYFTDSSTRFQRRDWKSVVNTGDSTGRLMSYDPNSKKLSVLIKGLTFPNGVAISQDGTFLLVTETTACRILKYWIRGPRAGTFEIFAHLPGYPDNITKNLKGEFWVAVNKDDHVLFDVTEGSRDVRNPGLRKEYSIALRISKEGRVLEELEESFLTNISEVQENNGTLWVGSVIVPYVGVYKL